MLVLKFKLESVIPAIIIIIPKIFKPLNDSFKKIAPSSVENKILLNIKMPYKLIGTSVMDLNPSNHPKNTQKLLSKISAKLLMLK